MGIMELMFLGVGLSMDALAISITNVLCYKNLKIKEKLAMPLAFGIFQGAMPLIGFYAGSLFASFIHKYAGIITLIILGYIGVTMILDTLKKDDDDCDCSKVYSFKTMILQAIATSIDAFAVGISLAAQNTNILYASIIICLITTLLCFIALWFGRKFGNILGNKAQLLGGVILLLIGIKAIF